jgi:hypothetical protein
MCSSYVLTYKDTYIQSLNAIVAQSKLCQFGADTTDELKNVTTSDNIGIPVSRSSPLDAIIVGCSCYMF